MNASSPMPSAIEAAEAIREGRLGALELVEHCLGRIEAGNDTLNAFVHLDPDGARRAAESVDARVAAGEGELAVAGQRNQRRRHA